jgi:hypothetical protein
MEKMLDAGFCLSASRCLASWRALHGRRVGFAFSRGGRGCWLLKVFILILSSIKHPVSAHSGINVRFQDFVIFGSGLSGLGFNLSISSYQ